MRLCEVVSLGCKVRLCRVRLQIKCLRELNCDPGSFYLNTCVGRSWLLADDEGTKSVCRQGLLRYGPVANSGGSGKKRKNFQMELFL